MCCTTDLVFGKHFLVLKLISSRQTVINSDKLIKSLTANSGVCTSNLYTT